MPNGRPYESPLNKLADALPTFLMEMQNMKMRQEAQEALNSYRQTMLAQTIRMNDLRQDAIREAERSGAIEQEREISEDMLRLESQGEGWAAAKYGREMVAQYYPEGIPTKRIPGPPIVDVLGKRIEKDLDILRDPDTAFKIETGELTENDVNIIKNRVISTQAEIRRQSDREYYVDPALIKIKPKEKRPGIDAGIVKPVDKPEMVFPTARPGETEADYRRRIDPALRAAAAGAERLLGLPEEAEALAVPAVEGPVEITTDEEYTAFIEDESIPSGTVFIDPEGERRYKP